jgi:copper chaperone CopZ
MSPNENLKVTEMQCLSCKNMIPAGLDKCDVCGKVVHSQNQKIIRTTQTIVHKQESDNALSFTFGTIGVVLYILGFLFRWSATDSPESLDAILTGLEISFNLFTLGTMFFFLAILTKK